MKIIHVINGLTSGGAEKLVYEIAQGVNQNDISIEILCLSKKYDVYSKELLNHNIRVVHLSKHSVYNMCLLFDLLFFFAKNKYDCIHVHLFPALYYISVLKKIGFLKSFTIYHEHNTENRRSKYKIFNYIDKFIYSSYNRIICISDAVKDRIVERKIVDSNKIIVIYNGINIQLCKNAIAINRTKISNTIKDDDILLIMIARFTAQKDHKTLIKSMKLLPSKYKLLLLGEGELMQKTMQFTILQNLQNRIYFLGYQSNVYSYIKACNLFILSSHWEGFGLVSVESMACGCPVIASNVDGLKEVVNGAGVLFTPHDEKELAEKIIDLSSNNCLYNKIQEEGYKRADKYSIETMLKKLVLFYSHSIKNE